MLAKPELCVAWRKKTRADAPREQPRLLIIALLVLAGNSVLAQEALKAPIARASPVGKTRGADIFAARCAGCHGLDGRGGQRAPNIATEPGIRHLPDAELAQTIRNGKTDFGMPAFRELGEEKLQSLVDYLRTLQGAGVSTSLAGNPESGKTIFFGRGGCSSCHSAAGQALFVGSDLSSYARGLTSIEIRKAILEPASATGRTKTALAKTRDGQEISGAVLNEDNFSIQLQSSDGAFHFLSKSDIEKLEFQRQPPMPLDYGKRLSMQELNDLVGFLQSLRSEPSSDSNGDQ